MTGTDLMKRKSLSLVCIIFCICFLSGCGGQYAGVAEEDAVSSSAVSGETVSGDAIREKVEQDMSCHRFCTDTNLYYVSEDEEMLMQARLDGTHSKCITECEEESGMQLVYVDENWLYYDRAALYDGSLHYAI